MGEVAERVHELGQLEKAKDLFDEGLKIASQFTDKTDFQRGMFAARLVLVDPPAAEAIARDFKRTPKKLESWVTWPSVWRRRTLISPSDCGGRPRG